MKKNLMWRSVTLLAAVLIAIGLFMPSLPGMQEKLPDWWPGNKIVLGLDLQGGMHLVYRVEKEEAVRAHTAQLINRLVSEAEDEDIAVKETVPQDDGSFRIVLEKPEAVEAVNSMAADRIGVLKTVARDTNSITYTIQDEEADRIRANSVTQAVETIRNRVDEFGVAEPIIVQQGDDEILVQLPGIKDTDRALSLIGKTALLEFKMLDEERLSSLDPPLPATVLPGKEDELLAQYEGKLPPGDEILFQRSEDPNTGAISKHPYLVKSKVELTGASLVDARVAPDRNSPGRALVNFELDPTGADIFGTLTRNNIKKRLAIILDNNLYSAPVIQSAITGGSGQITGNFSDAEAHDLAIVLRAGALPAPMTLIQNLTVGPTLGGDSIAAGKVAVLLGAALVVLFMLVYYGMSGAIADFAIALNLIILIGAMAALNATLTLPGIAGIILTIGMGVDSNVLIFERIREEVRLGKSIPASIDGGYDKAFWTIFDSHVTTLITAVVLFQFGTGPIKGFAVTLSLGVLINLFTALVGTKVVFDFINMKFRLKKLSI